MTFRVWHPRSPERLSDTAWSATLRRVRSEFDEMPCLRVTRTQARILFGLSDTVSVWVLSRLERDGFLEQQGTGEYTRRGITP